MLYSQHRPVEKTRATPLVVWDSTKAGGIRVGVLRIEIHNCDPRLVLVPQLWIERVAEPANDQPACVLWSHYSARTDKTASFIVLSDVPGSTNRPLRPLGSHRADGCYTQGDNLELQASTPLAIGIVCTDPSPNAIDDALGQILWFALDAYPADPGCTSEQFERMLHDLQCHTPAVPLYLEGTGQG
jgi:hypothetical protein